MTNAWKRTLYTLVISLLIGLIIVYIGIEQRMDDMKESIAATEQVEAELSQGLDGSKKTIAALIVMVDELNVTIEERLVEMETLMARVQSEIAARPVINIKYGTVLNTDGELVVHSDGAMLIEGPVGGGDDDQR